MADSPVLDRVRTLITPIVSDLQLDLYDLEMRGATLRVVVDTPPNSDSGVNLDTIALATRLIGREFDHTDPIPGSYTLEVSSPGVERTLRTPEHFQREVGKIINLRLANVEADQRRLQGLLVAADDTAATVRLNVTADTTGTTGATAADVDTDPDDRVVPYDDIDRARTVFVWGPEPKKGGSKKGKSKGKKKSKKR